MKPWVLFVLCILGFVSGQAAVPNHKTLERNSTTSSPARNQKTPPSQKTVPKSSGKVPTSYLTQRSHSATGSPARNQKTTPSQTTVPKSSGKVPTSYLTQRSHGATGSPSRNEKKPASHTSVPKSNEKGPIPTITSSNLKASAKPTTQPNSPISRGSSPPSTKTPKSSPPPTTTTANSTTTQKSTGTSTLVSASKTLTVSGGQTASAQVGWIIYGVGIGGSVAVGGDILHIAGGTEVIIVENSSGQDEASTIDSDTSTTSTSTSTSKSTSKSSSSSSTSSSTASPTPYNIYPKLDSTAHQQSAFAKDLEKVALPGSVRRITGIRDRLLLWVASLTPAQASELGRNPVVRGLNVDRPLQIDLEKGSASGTPPSSSCPLEKCSQPHQKRDGHILMQQDALDDLKLFSQARGASLSGLPGYAYDSQGGRGITVYVIDTGINPGHSEFSHMEGSIRWLYLPEEPQIESDDVGHGTCVTSKVVGSTFGVAKSASIVIVKIYPIDGVFSMSRITAIWAVVARDVDSNDMVGKAVVSNSLGAYPAGMTEDDRITYTESLRDVIDLDVVVVASSGNITPQMPGFAVESYPALLASQFPMVVVGAVDKYGIYAPYSQGLAHELTVSAVGQVICANRRGGASQWTGTSFATPAVAGLSAYLLSLDQYRERLMVPGSVARNVRDLIKSLAYARLPLQPAVVWNGIDSRQIACPARRDTARSPGCPARNTTLPINPPPTKPPSGKSTTTVTSSSTNPPTPSIPTSTFIAIVTPSSNPLPSESSMVTVSPTTSNESGTTTLTILLSGSTETVTISEGIPEPHRLRSVQRHRLL